MESALELDIQRTLEHPMEQKKNKCRSTRKPILLYWEEYFLARGGGRL